MRDCGRMVFWGNMPAIFESIAGKYPRGAPAVRFGGCGQEIHYFLTIATMAVTSDTSIFLSLLTSARSIFSMLTVEKS